MERGTPTLTDIGLRPGDRVRFRRRDSQRWTDGTVTGREKDGSIGIFDGRGHRAIPVEHVEVRSEGPRGGAVWEPAVARAVAADQQQLHLKEGA